MSPMHESRWLRHLTLGPSHFILNPGGVEQNERIIQEMRTYSLIFSVMLTMVKASPIREDERGIRHCPFLSLLYWYVESFAPSTCTTACVVCSYSKLKESDDRSGGVAMELWRPGGGTTGIQLTRTGEQKR